MKSLVPLDMRPPADSEPGEGPVLFAGALAMSAFVMFGIATVAGWSDPQVGIAGSVGAALSYLAVLVRAHFDGRSR